MCSECYDSDNMNDVCECIDPDFKVNDYGFCSYDPNSEEEEEEEGSDGEGAINLIYSQLFLMILLIANIF